MKWVLPDRTEINHIIRSLDSKVFDALVATAEHWASVRAKHELSEADIDEGYEYDLYVEELIGLALLANTCQSPPEQLLVMALNGITRDESGQPNHTFHCTQQFSVKTQRGTFRLDFVVDYWPMSEVEIAVGVEVDGHQWHDKTHQQAARDKSRDRALTAHGFPVLRFTASEVIANPDGCAEEVRNVLLNMWARVQAVGKHYSLLTYIRLLARKSDKILNEE